MLGPPSAALLGHQQGAGLEVEQLGRPGAQTGAHGAGSGFTRDTTTQAPNLFIFNLSF